MADKKRTYKKRTYKRKFYKRRFYKKRRYFYKRKPLKKPEIHITENEVVNKQLTNLNGVFTNLTNIASDDADNYDNIQYKINDKKFDGKKIRLKYLYIKGYIKVENNDDEDFVDADDFNLKLMIFRRKRNMSNNNMTWTDIINTGNVYPDGPSVYHKIDLTDPSNWNDSDKLWMMYEADYKNDIRINFYRKVKNLYRKYDDANNIIPFKIRVPLYDCVLTCDCKFENRLFTAYNDPSTNGVYFTILTNNTANKFINYKYKLYYTDY